MTKQVEGQPEGKKDLLHKVFWTMALLLPSVLWMLFGWLTLFFPLIVFVYIQKFGWKNTNSHLFAAIPAAMVVGFFLQSLELIAFTVLFLPAGYVIAYAVQHGEKPWKAGMKGWLVLCCLFFIFISILSVGSEISFMQAITSSLDRGVEEALRQYSQSDNLSAENYEIVESTLLQAKKIAPLILPAIFGSVLLLVSWITIVVGNAVLPRFDCRQPWPPYKYWKLPDKLIWGFIVFAILAILPGGIVQKAGINCLILTALLYSFQGLAIIVYYLEKLNVPKFVRAVIYIMIILQSFGTILLTIAGITDVWFDIRKIDQSKDNRKSDAD